MRPDSIGLASRPLNPHMTVLRPDQTSIQRTISGPYSDHFLRYGCS